MSDVTSAGAMADDLPAPAEGLVLTHFLTVSDVPRSRAFYAEVLGGRVVLDENPCIVKVANGWIIMNPGGGPTDDKPDVVLRTPEDPHTVSSFLNVRVADIHAFYATASAKGAEFLTPPIDRRAELRCYMRDPDGYLIEVGQATGLLKGILARVDTET
ncbi:VOC family protein [Streptomyces sp. YKOK-J1]